MSATVLERILQSTRQDLEARKRRLPLESLPAARARAEEGPLAGRPLSRALSTPGIGVIAEFKRRSPSAGELSERPDLHAILGAYERGGACAVSVLTEGPHFDGSLEDLDDAREACELPLLRKDFIVDAYQLHEARAHGADAVLLIVAALEQAELASLHDAARALGLDALVEVHDRDELQRALEIDAELIGINNRDLRDFTIDLNRTVRLMEDVPPGVRIVSESGISTPEQLLHLESIGVSGVLVGESLMRSPDPEATLLSLRTGG